MSALDPADLKSEQLPEKPISRFWRWGVWLWVVVWIISILWRQDLWVSVKGFWGMNFYLEGGSARVTFSDICTHNHIGIWDHWAWKHLLESPEDCILFFGNVGWWRSCGRLTLAIPIAGLFWLWLIGNWTVGFRNSLWPKSFANRRAVARCVVVFLLPLLVVVSDQQSRSARRAAECAVGIRNIQQAVRSYIGMNNIDHRIPIDMPWNEIFGPRNFLPLNANKCPDGSSYHLISHVPDVGVLAAECPNPEHQKRVKALDTSDW